MGVARERPLSSKRWLCAKWLSGVDDSIIALYRTRGLEVECLSDGRWEPADPQDWFTIREQPGYEWLTRQEVINLNYYLRSGQTEIPQCLNLEPPERYRKWKCPTCGTYTIVPIVTGLPNPEDMEAAMEGHIILQGCIVYGDEPKRPVGCTTCGWYGEHLRGKTIRELPPSQAFRMEDGDVVP